ncbi:alpha/beta hydrolase [Clostridiaceae bacterium HSG29]|nr:alpha/beta hydrolase [Clostridiaceae bacterium HSG29]
MKYYPLERIDIGDEIIAYRKAGNGGKKLLLIHGNMTSSVHFNILMDKISNDYEIIAPDLRGFGESSYNNSFNSLEELANDLKLFIEKIGFNDFDVLGWSTGGGVALYLAKMLPKLINKVYLVESVGAMGYAMYKKDENFQPILNEILLTKEDIEKDPVQVAPALYALKDKDTAYYKMIWDMLIYNNGNFPEPDLYDVYLNDMLTQKNLVDIDYSLTRFNITDNYNEYGKGDSSYRKIEMPIVIIHGKKDIVVPYTEAEGMKELFKDQAKLITFENSGHSPFIDNMQELIKAIKEN